MSGGIMHDKSCWDWLPAEIHQQIFHEVSKSWRERLPYLEQLIEVTSAIRVQLDKEEPWINDHIQATDYYVFISCATFSRITCAFGLYDGERYHPWYIRTPYEYSLYWFANSDSRALQISNCYWDLFGEKWKHQSIKYMFKGLPVIPLECVGSR